MTLLAAYSRYENPLFWTAGVDRNYWYQWENGNGYGRMWENNQINSAGIAFVQVRNWLLGATVPNQPVINGSVYSVELFRTNGYQGKVVWHDRGSSNHTIPAGKYVRYRDLTGKSTAISSTATSVPISNSAILLESQ